MVGKTGINCEKQPSRRSSIDTQLRTREDAAVVRDMERMGQKGSGNEWKLQAW